MPDCSVTQDIAGKSAIEIFSTDLFIQAIKDSADKLQIDVASLEEKSLPLYLEACLDSDTSSVREAAGHILKIFGERLAVILLCLKEGSPENRRIRSDWTDEHWAYWHSLQQIILVGGLASPPLGNHLKHYIEQVFDASGKHPYIITLGTNSTYAGLKGCASYLKNPPACITDITANTVSDVNTNAAIHPAPAQYASLIFDYGQSFIKRSYAVWKEGQPDDIVILDKTLSRHVKWDVPDPDTEKSEAIALNNHFLETIAHTIKEVEAAGFTIRPHIVLSIANYVKDGVIANRGGYGKLRLIAPDYARYLSERLKDICGKDFYFTLIHDGTAMAAGYSNYKDAVCISLGTAFGVGFPPVYDE